MEATESEPITNFQKENEYVFDQVDVAQLPSVPLPNTRMLPPATEIRKVREPVMNPDLFPQCMPVFLTSCKTADRNRLFIRGVINNPANPDTATNVSLVVSDVQSYFFINFKFGDMNPSIYPERIENFLTWLERHCLGYKSFRIPVGGDISRLQVQYNPLHPESWANAAKKKKNKRKSGQYGDDMGGLESVDNPEDLKLFSKWQDVSKIYKTMYGYSPGPLETMIQVWVTRPEVTAAICRFVESIEYCKAVAKFYPFYMVRIFEGKQIAPEQQFRLDRGLVIGQFCHVFFVPGEKYLVDDEDQLELYGDLEFHIDESQLFPMPPPSLLPTPPIPKMNILSYDIETNNTTTINPYTGMKQTRFSKAIWKPKDIVKHLNDQKLQFKNGKKYRLDNFGSGDEVYGKLTKMEIEFYKAIEAMIRSVSDRKPWDNLLDWYEDAKESYQAFMPYLDIPNPLDVDQILVIVAVLNVYNKPREKPLAFPRTVAFVLLHPLMEKPIDRTLRPGRYTAMTDEYARIELREFTNPLTMIGAFVDQIHAWAPTLITGWNDSSFDEPYIWDVTQFHQIYNKRDKTMVYKENGKATEFGKPNFGMLRKFEKSQFKEGSMFRAAEEPKTQNPHGFNDDEEDLNKTEEGDEEAEEEEGTGTIDVSLEKGKSHKKKAGAGAKKNPTRISQAMKAHVTMPMVTSMDGLVVWQNPSFGVKSTMESKGTRPQYSLDNVSSIELRYPGTDLDLPRRKLQVSHSETPNIWKRGGADLWFFICYCYVDASLPLLLLEKHAKVQLLFALAKECNCSMDIIYNNGMLIKISALFFANARKYEGGQYLVPEWGLRGLHWPDIWLDANPYTKAFTFAYLRPRPAGTKGYMGALVMEPSRMLHSSPIATKDYNSLYPTTAASHHFDYDKLLTNFMIEYYKIPSNMFARQVLGTKKEIFCGEFYQSDASMHYDTYNTTLLKDAKWYVKDGGFINAIISNLIALRGIAKKNMGRWAYYNKFVTTPEKKWPPADPTGWNPETLVPGTLKEKLGPYWWDVMYKAAGSLATWKAEYEKIKIEILASAPPGIVDLDYISAAWNRVYDAEQLALKLILNSIYGFTGADLASAILPCTEIAASITSEGRRIIRMTAAFCESRTMHKLKMHLERTANKTISPSPLGFGSTQAEAILSSPQTIHLSTFDLLQWLPIPDDDNEAMNVDYPPPKIMLHQLVIPTMDTFKSEPGNLKMIQDHYEQQRMPDHLVLHGGDTDSVMIGYPRQFCLLPNDSTKEDYELVQRMASSIVGTITSFLHGCMGLTQEKTSKSSLMVDPKNYYMSVLGMKEILCKGVEIVRGDTFGICNRLIGFAAKELIHKATFATFPETFVRVFKYIQTELIKVAQGKVVFSEFIKNKKLAKVSYTNIPEHVVVAQKMAIRGQVVNPGDFIVYTYADIVNPDNEALRLKRFDRDEVLNFVDKKGGAIAEDVEYLINTGGKLDVEHCMKLVINPVIKFFRHIVAPRTYPPIDDMASTIEQSRVATLRAKVKDEQNQEIYELMFRPIDDILKKRCEIKMRQILKMNTITSMFLNLYENECQYCSAIFNGVNRKQAYCPECLDNAEDIQHSLQDTITKARNGITDTKVNHCRNCIDFAGFTDIEIDRCTKYDCEVYEKRSRLTIDEKQAQKQLTNIRDVITTTTGGSNDRPQKHARVEIEFDKSENNK